MLPHPGEDHVTTGHDSADERAGAETGPGRGGVRTRADRMRRLVRYTGVNLASLVVDYAVFLSLMGVLGLPVVASVAGYAVAFALNYKLSRLFVFVGDGGHKSDKRLFTEFMATGLLGIVLTATVTAVGVHLAGLAPTIAKAGAMLICFATLYLVRSRLVFTRRD